MRSAVFESGTVPSLACATRTECDILPTVSSMNAVDETAHELLGGRFVSSHTNEDHLNTDGVNFV